MSARSRASTKEYLKHYVHWATYYLVVRTQRSAFQVEKINEMKDCGRPKIRNSYDAGVGRAFSYGSSLNAMMDCR